MARRKVKVTIKTVIKRGGRVIKRSTRTKTI